MGKFHSIVTAIVFVASLLIHHVEAASFNFDMDIYQLGSATGDPTYEVRPALIGGFPFQSIIAPDGTNFAAFPFSSPIDVTTFSDLSSRFFGTWSILRANDTGYQFTFSPFSLDDYFHEVPQIVSPLDGAHVNPTFEVDWAFTSGHHDTSGSLSISGANATSTFGDMSYTVNITSPLPDDFQVRAGTVRLIAPSNFSAVTTVGSSGSDTFLIRGLFESLSAPVSLTAVPEPGTFLLAAVAAGGIAAMRRKFRN